MIDVARHLLRDCACGVLAVLDSRPSSRPAQVYEERKGLRAMLVQSNIATLARRNGALQRHLESAFRSLGVSEGRGLGMAMEHCRMVGRPGIVEAKRRKSRPVQ